MIVNDINASDLLNTIVNVVNIICTTIGKIKMIEANKETGRYISPWLF